MDNRLLIPSSIIVAGAIVAGALLYSKTPSAVPSPNLQVQQAQNQKPPAAANLQDILKIKNNDFVLGNPSAKVVMVEYGDFQCPFCEQFFKTSEKNIIEQYVKTGKVAFVWRDFAFLGQESVKAAEAARCAGEQGKFWDFHDYLFTHQNGENQGAFSDDNIKSFAKNMNFNTQAFNQCFDSGKYAKAVVDSANEGKSVGVTGTPASFINGQMVSGAVPFGSFQSLIEQELKK